MAESNLFAPPTPEELAALKKSPAQDLFAPPTAEELASLKPQSDQDQVKANIDRLNQHKFGDSSSYSPGEKKGVIDAYGRGLDYLGGGVRTAIAGAGGLLTGKPIVSNEDLKNTAIGKAPSSAEYMTKAGVPEGPSMDLPVVGKVTARGVGGFLGDVATDPLTHGAGSVSALNPVGEATEKLGENAYKSGFKKIDERVLQKNLGKTGGTTPLSETLLQNGAPTGSTKDIYGKVYGDDGLLSGAKQSRDAVLQKASDAGAEVDMNKATSYAQDLLDKLKATKNPDPSFQDMVTKLQQKVDAYKGAGGRTEYSQLPEQIGWDIPKETNVVTNTSGKATPTLRPNTSEVMDSVPKKYEQRLKGDVSIDQTPIFNEPKPGEATFPEDLDKKLSFPQGGQYARVAGPNPMQASDWKTAFYNKAGDAAYNEISRTPLGKQFEQAMGRGHKEAIEDAVAKSLSPEEASKLKDMNGQMGSMLESKRPMVNQVRKGETPNYLTSTDAIIGGLGLMGHSPEMGAAALALKKAADLSKTTYARTKLGKGLMKAGESGAVQGVANRGLVNYGK